MNKPERPLLLLHRDGQGFIGWFCDKCGSKIIPGKYHQWWKFWGIKENLECKHIGIQGKNYYRK